MATVIPFNTGKVLSSEAAVAVSPGTNVADLSDAQEVAKNRRWEVLAAADGANMPYNPYRMLIIIDATQSTEDAFVVINGGDDPANTAYAHRCEAGGYMELTRALGEVGPEPMSVVAGGTTASPIVIFERSAD
jgi:hypothetical protein